MTDQRLVLVSLTGLDDDHLAELFATADDLGATVACLQGGGPSLVGVLDTIAAEAAGTSVRLVAAARTTSHTGRSWLGRVAGHWVRTRGLLQVEVAGALARGFGLIEVRAACSAPARLVTGGEAPLESPAWEEAPPYRHHVLVCRGPRCNAKGAEETSAALTDELTRREMVDRDVLVALTGCLYPCNGAPVIVCHPGDRWYRQVTADEARRIVEDDLLGD
ncbi:(2Fe-2S) ferredoxin domain-containing protein [Flexivirga meconopsidis]|uniref:(2Fe-2S) ferredoxin domain-containing protein n=1 Tax=Flexivirga meconopsidis TaxID=2977121 RepID=UPI002240A94B|nr:(2Fe-2S) ferredoxin domain-containing protein [Flexivirga meconopsidis]